jgi:hypothetical protein
MNEEILFNLIKKLIPDLSQTNQFSFRDAYSKKHDLSIELKCRYKNYQQLIIEKIKYDNLIRLNSVRYINSMPSGIYSFNLKKIEEPIWFEKELPVNTEFENKNKIEKLKKVKIIGLLDLSLSDNITKLL